MNKIKIVCDSLSDVTDQQIEKYDIEFIPLNIIIGDNEYKDRQDISIDNFYSIIRNVARRRGSRLSGCHFL